MAQRYRCYRGAGDISADIIIDPLIISQSLAVARGKRFFDDKNEGGFYLVRNYVLKVPHKNHNIFPGKWVVITISKLNITSDKFKVITYAIERSKAGAWGRLEVESYHTMAKTPTE